MTDNKQYVRAAPDRGGSPDLSGNARIKSKGGVDKEIQIAMRLLGKSKIKPRKETTHIQGGKRKTNLKIYRWELFNSGYGESAITGVG